MKGTFKLQQDTVKPLANLEKYLDKTRTIPKR